MHSISDDEDDDDDIDDYLDEYEMMMVKPVKLVMVMVIVPKKHIEFWVYHFLCTSECI